MKFKTTSHDAYPNIPPKPPSIYPRMTELSPRKNKYSLSSSNSSGLNSNIPTPPPNSYTYSRDNLTKPSNLSARESRRGKSTGSTLDSRSLTLFKSYNSSSSSSTDSVLIMGLNGKLANLIISPLSSPLSMVRQSSRNSLRAVSLPRIAPLEESVNPHSELSLPQSWKEELSGAHPEIIMLAIMGNDHIKPCPLPKSNNSIGLINLGNTCYMNSVIQCLMAIHPVASFFFNSDLEGSVAKAFSQFASQFLDKSYGNVSPASLKRALQVRARQFIGNDQHDSQEFLRTFLNELHNDLNTVKEIPKFTYQDKDFDYLSSSLKAEISWNRSKMYENSIIQDFFCGQLESRVTCSECNYVSVTFDLVWDLSVPVAPTGNQIYSSLEQCLTEYFKEEILETLYKCDRCKVPRKATKKLFFSRLPRILVLHLKRFNEHTRKLSHPISFPFFDLNLGAFQTAVGKKNCFDLVGVSNHFGSLFGGHYTASTRNWGDNNWMDRNDSHVSTINTSNPCDNKASYILFYISRDFL